MKDAEVARLQNELASALARVNEWSKVAVEVDRNHRKAAKRDRAGYMKRYREKRRAEAR